MCTDQPQRNMKSFKLIILLVLLCQGAMAQVYQVGVISSGGMVMKYAGEIAVSDSTISFNIGSQQSKKKIQSKSDNVIYLTDGTAIDRLTITPITGKLKGFMYTCMILYSPDKKFSSQDMIYYANAGQ
jgi:hypothetical protein